MSRPLETEAPGDAEERRVTALVSDKATDVERWSQADNFNPAWVGRARTAANLVPQNARVLDLGCGQQVFKQVLPDGCTYTPADIKQWTEDVVRIDLNEGLWPEGQWDVVVSLGVLEYIYDIDKYFSGIAERADVAVISYSVPNALTPAAVAARRRTSWLTDFEAHTIVAAAYRCGFLLDRALMLQRTPDFHQILFKFAK